MEISDRIFFGIAGFGIGLLIGAGFIVEFSKHLIRTGKRVPAFLREVGVTMPEKSQKGQG